MSDPDPRRWKALSATLVAGFMSLLDVSVVSVALPSIQQGLGTSPAGVQWLVSGYALAFGLALVPAGRLGDALGRRRMFLLAPQNSALIQQLFSGAERGRAFGRFGATVGISTAVGPVVGGLILALAGEAEGWRWIFFVNLPIGAVALVLAAGSSRAPAPGSAATSTCPVSPCSAAACSRSCYRWSRRRPAA